MAKADEQLKNAFEYFHDCDYVPDIVRAIHSNTRFEVGDVLLGFIVDTDYDDDDNELVIKSYFKLNENESYVNPGDDEDEIDDDEIHKILGDHQYEIKTRFQVVGKDPKTGIMAVSAMKPNGKLCKPYVPMAVYDITECNLMEFELDPDYEDSLLLEAEFDIKEIYKRDQQVLNEQFERVAAKNKQSCIQLPIEDFDISKLQLTLLSSLGKVKNNTNGHIEVWATTGADKTKFWAAAKKEAEEIYVHWKVGRTGKISMELDDIESFAEYTPDDAEFVAVWLNEPQEVEDGKSF